MLAGQASFSGLLPVTVYDEDFTQRRPITNLNLRDAGGVTYRYFEGQPLYRFGHGLSYASFEFRGDGAARLHTTVAAAESRPLCFNVSVSNDAEGGVSSDVVVLARAVALRLLLISYQVYHMLC